MKSAVQSAMADSQQLNKTDYDGRCICLMKFVGGGCDFVVNAFLDGQKVHASAGQSYKRRRSSVRRWQSHYSQRQRESTRCHHRLVGAIENNDMQTW